MTLQRLVAAALVCLGMTAGARANTATFVLPSGATDSAGEAISAQAVFTTSNNSILVQLTNLITDQTSVGQALTNLTFSLSSAISSATPASLTSSSAIQRVVNSDHTYTDSGTVSTLWGFPVASGHSLQLDWFSRSASQASNTLLGAPGANNQYNNANGSIVGNPGHTPFLAGTATFTINAPGVTSSTNITAATFSFGTTPGDTHTGVPSGGGGGGTPGAVPEPSSVILLGLGFGAIVFGRRARARAGCKPRMA